MAAGVEAVRPFLGQAMDPPEEAAVHNAITRLQAIGAMDAHEALTPLVRPLPLFLRSPCTYGLSNTTPPAAHSRTHGGVLSVPCPDGRPCLMPGHDAAIAVQCMSCTTHSAQHTAWPHVSLT